MFTVESAKANPESNVADIRTKKKRERRCGMYPPGCAALILHLRQSTATIGLCRSNRPSNIELLKTLQLTLRDHAVTEMVFTRWRDRRLDGMRRMAR
jgi:hypothetical protein